MRSRRYAPAALQMHDRARSVSGENDVPSRGLKGMEWRRESEADLPERLRAAFRVA